MAVQMICQMSNEQTFGTQVLGNPIIMQLEHQCTALTAKGGPIYVKLI